MAAWALQRLAPTARYEARGCGSIEKDPLVSAEWSAVEDVPIFYLTITAILSASQFVGPMHNLPATRG